MGEQGGKRKQRLSGWLSVSRDSICSRMTKVFFLVGFLEWGALNVVAEFGPEKNTNPLCRAFSTQNRVAFFCPLYPPPPPPPRWRREEGTEGGGGN